MAKSIDANDITFGDVKDLVPIRTKGNVKRSGEVEVFCPIEPSLTFEIHVETGEFKCFRECAGCPVAGKGRAVNLYRLYNPDLSFKEACIAIAEHKCCVSDTTHSNPESFKLPVPIHNVEAAPIDDRDKTYRELLGLLELRDSHRKDLHKRGLNDAQIEEFGVKSIPTCGIISIPKTLSEKGCRLNGVPLFGKNNKDVWQLCSDKGKNGYFIPYFDMDGKIQQLQIRYDVTPSKNMNEAELHELKKRRYRWATSTFAKDGCSANNIPFWGRYSRFKDSDTVIVTEGGLKASVSSYISNKWFVAIPGVTCYEPFKSICKWCKENNKKMVEAFDMDGKLLNNEKIIDTIYDVDGKPLFDKEIMKEMKKSNRILVMNESTKGYRVINESVKNALTQLYSIAKEFGIDMIPWRWDPEYKGIDDWLLAQSYRDGSMDWNNNLLELKDDSDNNELSCNKSAEKENKCQPVLINGRINKFYLPKIPLRAE